MNRQGRSRLSVGTSSLHIPCRGLAAPRTQRVAAEAALDGKVAQLGGFRECAHIGPRVWTLHGKLPVVLRLHSNVL